MSTPLGENDFDAFCGTRIKMFLNAGQTMRYERIATYKEEKYELLHTFWYVMPSG